MKNQEKKNLRHLSQEEIKNVLEGVGEKSFRTKQVWEWLWQKHAFDFQSMSNLSKTLRGQLEEAFL